MEAAQQPQEPRAGENLHWDTLGCGCNRRLAGPRALHLPERRAETAPKGREDAPAGPDQSFARLVAGILWFL